MVETNTLTGYSVSYELNGAELNDTTNRITLDGGGTVTIINAKKPNDDEIIVKKVWLDENGQLETSGTHDPITVDVIRQVPALGANATITFDKLYNARNDTARTITQYDNSTPIKVGNIVKLDYSTEEFAGQYVITGGSILDDSRTDKNNTVTIKVTAPNVSLLVNSETAPSSLSSVSSTDPTSSLGLTNATQSITLSSSYQAGTDHPQAWTFRNSLSAMFGENYKYYEYRVNETSVPDGYMVSYTYGGTTEEGAMTGAVSNGLITINNTFDNHPDQFTPQAHKTFLGTTALTAGQFSFGLYEVDGSGVEAAEPIQTKQNAADGSVTFDTITYTDADIGTHEYHIKEMAGSDSNISYDDTVHTLTVTVEKAGNVVTASGVYRDGAIPEFVNTKKTDVTVKKTWETGDKPTEDWTATFKLQKARVAKIAENGAMLPTPVETAEENWVWEDVAGQDNITINQDTKNDTVTLTGLDTVEQEGNAVYSLKYRVVETSLTIGSSSANRIDPNTGDYLSQLVRVGDADNSYAIIVNNKVDDTKTSITVNKVWQGGNPPADASVGVTIRRYKLMPDEGTLTVVDNTSIQGLLAGDSATVAYTMVPGTYNVSTGSYTITKTVTVDGDKYTPATYTENATATVTLETPGTATFTGTPTFTRKTGTLTINDSCEGAPDGYTYSASYVVTDMYGVEHSVTGNSIEVYTGPVTVTKTVNMPANYTTSSSNTATTTVAEGQNSVTMPTTVFTEQSGSIKTIEFGWDSNATYNHITIKAGIDSITIKESLNYGDKQSVSQWIITGSQGVSITTPTYEAGENWTHYMVYTVSGLNSASGDTITLSISSGTQVKTYSDSAATYSVIAPQNAIVTEMNNNSLSTNRSALSSGRGSLQALSLGGGARTLSAGNAAAVTGQVTVTTTNLSADSSSATTPTKNDLIPQMDNEWGDHTVTLTKNNNWTDVLTRLEKTDGAGHEYVYYIASVSETGVPQGTTVAITTDGAKRVVYGNEGGTLTVTDTLPKTQISAQKVWVDDNNAANARPTTIQFTLYVDGEVSGTQEVTSTNDWNVTWDNLELYKADGTPHTYSVTESAVDGYTLTSTTYANGLFTLTNTKDQPQTGDLTVSKTVDVGDTSKDFHFTVTLSDTSVNGTYGDMTFANGVATITLRHTQTATATGLPAGITYTVTEQAESGWSTTASNANGTIPAGGTAAASFTNTYSASGTTTFEGMKTIRNRSFKEGDTLSVTITSSDGGKLPTDASNMSVTLTNGQTTANFSFAAVTYTYQDIADSTATPKSKTFHYTVTETATMAGTTADSRSHTVEVTVTDNGNGTLDVRKVYKAGETVEDKTSFVNTYSASGSVPFTAHKTLTGGTLTGNDYEFTLKEYESNFATVKEGGVNLAVRNTADGVVNFGSVTLTSTATRYFIIEETAGDDSGIIYDTSRQKITVQVTDNNAGTLIPTKTYDPARASGSDDYDASFTNEQLGSVKVTKSFSGVDALPTEFQITATWTGLAEAIVLKTNDSGEKIISGGITVSAVTGIGSTEDPYAWTISNLPIGTVVTFTEENYTVAGYNVTATITPNNGHATADVIPGEVAITNEYVAGVELPATGGTGTLPYTLSGLTLLLGAALTLYYRRRRREQN